MVCATPVLVALAQLQSDMIFTNKIAFFEVIGACDFCFILVGRQGFLVYIPLTLGNCNHTPSIVQVLLEKLKSSFFVNSLLNASTVES